MALNINQFAQIPVQGELDLKFNTTVLSGEIASTENGTLVPGQAVVMADTAGGVPKFTAVASATDDIYGFISYDIKSQNFVAGDRIEVVAMRNGVMYMTASAAIARNAQVMVVVASKKVATATSSQRIIGRALDKASADGDLIRVTIDLPGATA